MRHVAATWTLWGFAAALLGLANLAVMGFHPTPNQHAVVGTGIPMVTLLAAAATQALWPHLGRYAWLVAWLIASALALLAAMLQGLLGNAFLYGLGEAGRASEEAPFALLGALWAGALTAAMPRGRRWPGAAAAALLAGLYVWASTWAWGGEGGALFGGAVLNGAVILTFSGAGWATALTAARTPEPAAPTPT